MLLIMEKKKSQRKMTKKKNEAYLLGICARGSCERRVTLVSAITTVNFNKALSIKWDDLLP